MEAGKQRSQPIVRDLVLVGGGHSHAIALKKFGMKPLLGVRLTLITDVAHTPYSGMLPGYVAGLYSFDDCHIDLRPLSQFAQAQMVIDRAIGLDLEQNRVLCANRPPIAFDLLSIDIGSTPTASPVPGALEHATPVKPISQFLHYWEQLVEAVTQTPHQPLRLGIVGGGAGGVELALSVQAHLQRIYQAAGQPLTNLELHLFHRGSRLLPDRNPWVGQQLGKILSDRGLELHLQESVSEVKPGLVRCESGLNVECDRVFWVTQAAAAPWLSKSGLATNAQGFIQVNDALQSVSHSQVFAAGDVATMVSHPRPKAGVFAVRQGKPLFQNLRNALLNKPLKPFIPQKKYLILVGTGDRAALASRDPFAVGPSPLLWRWKDRIDRKFMRQFTHLKPMGEPAPNPQLPISNPYSPISNPPSSMPCAGCGSKVGSSTLEKSLKRVQQEQAWISRKDVLIGLDAAEDAAVLQVPAGQAMVQTVDYFRALIDDPFLFGQISTNHCLSDLFAMGAEPQSALAIATLPYATPAKLEETLYQLLSGAVKTLNQAQAVLVGGHTSEGPDLAFGLSCNGLAHPDRLLRKSGMKPGHVLILTKALGTGTLFAADMQLKAKGRWIEAAIQSMLLSNQAASACLRECGAIACTDITGFGLIGHLAEMLRSSQASVELNLEAIPVMDGAENTLQQGIVSSLYAQNLQASRQIQNLDQVSSHPLFPLLFDPQTSGGLLAAVPGDRASDCLACLQSAGYPHSHIIGNVLPSAQSKLPITIVNR
ncbi:selenide, water dikinase SelD [Oculatella sp. FACHB-28]|uniref:selenide, water dikinase SelD n=1 Tax=Oculatella sp. FACHB-28 TaxID=2692845 RepID=UPI00322084AC